MGTRWSGILELLIVSVNYILIGYALSNIAMLLQSNPLFILFYGPAEISGDRALLAQGRKADRQQAALDGAVGCLFCAADWNGLFAGRVVGEMVPFYKS
mgnify:CR=1 FL=1